MNRRIIAALLVCSCAWAGAAGAATVAAADIRQNLFATCFISLTEGWAVGDLGRIFHTIDGAQTWEQQNAGTKRPFVALACPAKDQLWVAGQSGDIAHSADGGKTWTMQTSGTQRQLLDIKFATPTRGLAVGDFGTLLRTDDGGQTWSKIALPTHIKLPEEVAETVDAGDVLLYGISFPDADHAWIAAEFGVILASHDGGVTWESQDSPVESTLFSIYFTDQQRGWAVGLDSALLHTTDGGISWQKQPIETPRGFSLALYDVQVRGDYGWAVGDKGLLLSSTDGGSTWSLVKIPPQMATTWFRGISLLPEGRGFIVGAAGLVLAADRDQFTPRKSQF